MSMINPNHISNYPDYIPIPSKAHQILQVFPVIFPKWGRYCFFVWVCCIFLMLSNKPQSSNRKAYHQASLPKQTTLENRFISTRCISVAKADSKKEQMTSQNVPKHLPPIKQLTYYLGRGNNEGLIRRILGCRSAWSQIEDSTSTFLNLKWQQDQKGMKYEWLIDSGLYRALMNQFEFHQVLSNKELLFRNLEHYCQKNGIDIWKIVPPTYLLNMSDECNMMMLKQFTDAYQKNYPEKLKAKNGSQGESQIQQAKSKLKRFFFNSNLKKIMAKTAPITDIFLDEDGEYLWIVKPTFLNRGRGIQVFSKLEALVKFISQNITGYIQRSLNKDSNEESHHQKTVIDYVKRNSQQICKTALLRQPINRQRERTQEPNFDANHYIRVLPKGPAIIKTDKFLVQKYLQKPMLIMQRKFDIRIWVLVTYNLRGFVFKEGYVRLSSLQYSCTDSPANNTFMHLTNNAVQKFSKEYGSVADGNQLSFNHLKKQMENLGLNFQETLKTIHDDIRISLKATYKLLNPNNRKFCFQIYGYDFMIDKNGYPWLIQVNTNPCIEQSSKLLAMLIPRMLDDAFRLTVDPLFYGSVSDGKFPVDGYADKENMWLNLNIDK